MNFSPLRALFTPFEPISFLFCSKHICKTAKMAKGKPSPAPYRDGPDDDDAVSMHTTRDDYEYDDAPELPSYSDSEAAVSASRNTIQPDPLVHQQNEFSDPYQRVQPLTNWQHISNGKVKNSNETTIRMDKRLADPEQLESYVTRYLAAVPPRQLVRIMGTHQETRYNASSKKNEKETVVDFDISFSLASYLSQERGFRSAGPPDNSDSVYRGSFRKTRAKGYKHDIEVGENENPSLQDWCREYCNDKSALKIFRVTRNVMGLDTEYLLKFIEKFVRETHYHGHLNISFPIEEKNIDIYSDHWINRWRTGWQRWIFFVTFLWLIIWPILYLTTKWWSVYTIHWHWFQCRQDHEQQRTNKVYSGISEKLWANGHKNLIKSLVLEKYHGDATQFPTDVPDERVERGVRSRMPSTGNQNVDAAMNFIQGGVSAWNTLQGRGIRDPNAWGGDS